MKIVINDSYGGFDLSEEAQKRYLELGGVPPELTWYWFNIDRTHPALIQTVEELGMKAAGDYCNLIIEEIPAGTKYTLREYDGAEWIETEDDIDWKIAT